MAFTSVFDWLVTAIILTITTIIAFQARSRILRRYNQTPEPSESSTNYIYWYSYTISAQVVSVEGRLQRLERTVHQAIEALQRSQEEEVRHRQEVKAKIEENHWLLQGIRNRQETQGQQIHRLNQHLYNTEERLVNYLRDVKRDLTYWTDIQTQDGDQYQYTREAQILGEEEQEQESEQAESPIGWGNDWTGEDHWAILPDEAAWSTTVNPGTTPEDQPDRLTTIPETSETLEGEIFQDYLGIAQEDYRHPDSPAPETQDLNQEPSTPQTGESVDQISPLPVPNSELRLLAYNPRLGRSTERGQGSRIRTDSRERISPTLVQQNRGDILGNSVVIVEYRDTSSEGSESDISESVLENLQFSTDSENYYPEEEFGTDSEAET